MIHFSCPSCQKVFKVADDKAGMKVYCPQCNQKILIPPPPTPKTVLGHVIQPEITQQPRPSARPQPAVAVSIGNCPSCQAPQETYPEHIGSVVCCTKCGFRFTAGGGERVVNVVQVYNAPVAHGQPPRGTACNDAPGRSAILNCLLISAIANIVVGLIWAATCFGLAFTIPMAVLCIFEFIAWGQADSLSDADLAGRAKVIGIFEIIVGLANTATFVCGIIALISAGKLSRYARGTA